MINKNTALPSHARETYDRYLKRGFTDSLTKFLISNPNFEIHNVKELIQVFASKGGSTHFRYLESVHIEVSGHYTTQSDALRLIRLARAERLEPGAIRSAILGCPDIVPILEFKKCFPSEISDSDIKIIIYKFWEQISKEMKVGNRGKPGELSRWQNYVLKECKRHLGSQSFSEFMSTLAVMTA